MKRNLAALFFLLVSAQPASAADSCIDCHGSKAKMSGMGHPEFVFSAEEVAYQTKMPGVLCADCHRGDPSAHDKKDAHKDILAVRAVRQRTFEAVTRTAMADQDRAGWIGLEPRGNKRYTRLMPKRMDKGKVMENPGYRAIIFHDKNPGTLAFNPEIAMNTCGKCHEDKVRGFLMTSMGGAKGAHTQSRYTTWTGPTGPQSCGLWVGALSQPDQGSFSDDNVRNYNTHSSMPVSPAAAYNLQRNCNQCHVGCLDCHLEVRKKDGNPAHGPHTFTAAPSPLTCYGGGRAFSCHAGPLERRRGDGYLRGEFTQATAGGVEILNKRPDVHYEKNVTCVQCHAQKTNSGHADLMRSVDCGKCHKAVVEQHGKGPHKKVDCAACHTPFIGGYAFNFWTAVGPKGQENPLTRIQDYTTSAVSPVIVKNPDGVWIPVHIVPHTSGNVKAEEVKLSSGLIFRNRPDAAVDRLYRSNDAYAITGLAKAVDEKDRDVMVWLNLDRVAHATGRARPCGSCHESTVQRVRVLFSGGSYKDVEDGAYVIAADEKGLRITEFKGPEGGPVAKGLEPFMGKWDLKGDFALPEIKDRGFFRKLEGEYRAGGFTH